MRLSEVAQHVKQWWTGGVSETSQTGTRVVVCELNSAGRYHRVEIGVTGPGSGNCYKILNVISNKVNNHQLIIICLFCGGWLLSIKYISYNTLKIPCRIFNFSY